MTMSKETKAKTIATKLSDNLNNLIARYRNADNTADKMIFFCMASSLASESSWLDSGINVNDCPDYFNEVKNKWKAFVDAEGNGDFNSESSIPDISSVLLLRERDKNAVVKLENKLRQIISKLKMRDSVETDLYLIACGAYIIKENSKYKTTVVDEWFEYVANNYGVDLKESRDIGDAIGSIIQCMHGEMEDISI